MEYCNLKAPVLITTEMVERMNPGSVIVDLAALQGGNCSLTEVDQWVNHGDVQIFGPRNLPGLVPFHASQMYAKNISNLFLGIFEKGEDLNFEDEVTRETCVVYNGKLKNERIANLLEEGGRK